jgi:D-psicose/D-tagatose/L-ribulose 3-epimerase
MRFGLNTFLFTSSFGNQDGPVLGKARACGAEAIELAIGNPEAIDIGRLQEALTKNGFTEPVLCGMFTAGRNLRGRPEEAACAADYLMSLIRLAASLGTRVVCGPFYAQTGQTLNLRPDERAAMLSLLAVRLRPICQAAETAGITLAMEPLNRFETDCVNTLGQGAALVEAVGSPALRLHADTFHMHIEEEDSCGAIASYGPLIAHFHASANHRGELHRCQINWSAILGSLAATGYGGDIIIESFSPEDPAMARALCLWRPLFSSSETMAREGLALLRQKWQQAAHIPIPNPSSLS